MIAVASCPPHLQNLAAVLPAQVTRIPYINELLPNCKPLQDSEARDIRVACLCPQDCEELDNLQLLRHVALAQCLECVAGRQGGTLSLVARDAVLKGRASSLFSNLPGESPHLHGPQDIAGLLNMLVQPLSHVQTYMW